MSTQDEHGAPREHATAPNLESAAAALAAAGSSAVAIRKETIGMVVAMSAFAAASAIGVLCLGFVARPGGILSGTAFIVGASVALAVVGATAKARPRGFQRRYLTAIGVWTLLYLAVVLIGFRVLGPDTPPVFWIVGAVIVAVPGTWFTLTAARSGSR